MASLSHVSKVLNCARSCLLCTNPMMRTAKRRMTHARATQGLYHLMAARVHWVCHSVCQAAMPVGTASQMTRPTPGRD